MAKRNVALLRALNVGGTSVIPMKELAALFEAAGFSDVTTHGASGNVIYAAKGTPDAQRKKIEAALANHFGKPATAMVRTADEMRAIADEAPEAAEGTKVYVAFLADPVGLGMPRSVAAYPGYAYVGREREVYILRPADDPPGLDGTKAIDTNLPPTSATVRTLNVVKTLAKKSE